MVTYINDLLGARIDHAHHGNTARRALEEVVAMEEAVRRALTMVNTDETLLIVTADHSHPLNIGSYATRGNPILGGYAFITTNLYSPTHIRKNSWVKPPLLPWGSC